MIQDRNRWTPPALVAACLMLGGTHLAAQSLPTGHMPIPGGQETLAVVVLETLDGGGYTYVRVEMEGEEAWLAGPQAVLEVGDTVLVAGATPMESFTSSSLNRTFDLLYFVGGYQKHSGSATAVAGAGRPGVVDGPVGEAREVLHSGGYTYLRVDVEGESVWIAGPMTQVSEAAVVSWRGDMPMRDFTSRTLQRTFEEILFVQEIIIVR